MHYRMAFETTNAPTNEIVRSQKGKLINIRLVIRFSNIVLNNYEQIMLWAQMSIFKPKHIGGVGRTRWRRKTREKKTKHMIRRRSLIKTNYKDYLQNEIWQRREPLQSRTILIALIEFHFWYVPILIHGRCRTGIELIECAVDIHYLFFGYRTIDKETPYGCQFDWVSFNAFFFFHNEQLVLQLK